MTVFLVTTIHRTCINFKIKKTTTPENKAAHRYILVARIETMRRFVSSNVHVFRKHPMLVTQQALNQPDSSLAATAKSVLLARSSCYFQSHGESIATEEAAPVMTLLQQPEPVLSIAGTDDGSLVAAGLADVCAQTCLYFVALLIFC